MYFLLTTLGCKVNQYESSRLHAEMERLGYLPASDTETADIFILNSCTVTENSDKKARQLINSVKRKNPRAIIVLTGCFPQAFPESAKNLGADIICGTAQRKEIPLLIDKFIKTRDSIEKIMPCPDAYEEFGTFSPNSHKTRMFIKIQDGCDNNCAYCVIPHARGNPRSRSLDSVKEEALAAAEAGYKEIVLTGINLTKYGGSDFDLCDAVSAVSEYAERIRLSSVEPDMLTDRILENLSREKKLCPHFHISLQSGSDSVLRRMGRHYTAGEYYEKARKIRLFFGDGTALTTDMITGFPGETEEEFSQSLDFARKVNFSKIHVFPFSARGKTPAASMENQIPESVRRERRSRLIQVAGEMRGNFFDAQVGKTLSVLVEKRTSSNEVFGHADNYTPVKVLSRTAKQNDILRVIIKEAGEEFCTGI